jgi:hypothetical protein
MRNIKTIAALLTLASAAPAAAANIELGYFSFDTALPAGSGAGGVNTFNIANLTGAASLAPEAPATTPLTFLNASVTYTVQGAAPVTVPLGNLAPGAAIIPLTLQFPDTTTITSAQFNATLSASTATLAGNPTPQNLATTTISVSLTPAAPGAIVPIIVDAEPPFNLSFVQQPTTAVAGVALSPAVTVQLSGGGSAAVTLTSNPAGITATANTVSGVATFSNLVFNTAGSYTLTATANGVPSATSNSFTVSAAAPAKLSFLQPATNGIAGTALAPAVTVQIQDAFSNPTTSAAAVMLTSNPAGISTSANAVNGVATFSNLVFTSARSYTLTAASPNLTSVTGSPFTIAAGPASKLSFGQQPTNAGLGVALSPAPTVQLLDANNNLTNSTATVSVASNPAGVTATQAAVNGTATFSALVFSAPGSYTLSASSTGLPGVSSNSFTVGSGVLTLTTDKPAYGIGQIVTVSGSFLTSTSAPIAGATVAINLTLNGVTQTLSTTTNSSGAYSTTFQPASNQAGTFQVSATAAGGGVVNTTTASFRVVGLQLTTNSTSLTVVMGTSAAPALTILNSGNAALNALNITLTSNAPASVTGKLTLTGVPTSLTPGASAPFALAINTSTAPPPAMPVVFTITASAVDATSGIGVSQVLTITGTFEPATSSALLTPLSATLGVNPGASATQQYSITNSGYIPIPNATISLTNAAATPWIVIGNASLGPINPGQSATFQLIANPPATLTAQTVSVPFTISGASSPVSAILTVNVNAPGAVTGNASFNVQDDLGQYVSGATVTLISKANNTLTYQGATDANGNVNITGVAAGAYEYVAAATQHDPTAGSVTVTAGGFAQPNAVNGHVGPRASAPAATPIPVLLSYDVVTLTFSVTPTTVTDTYITQLLVLYSSYLVKPVLQVIPDHLDYSFYPQASYPPYPQCFPLKITNLNPTSEVTNVTIDSTQLDLATPAGARFQVFFFGPNSLPTDKTQTLNLGNLSGQHLATTPSGSPVAPPVTACATVNAADLITRSLGNITVSGQYTYSAPGGIATIGTTTTPVPVTYTFHPDVYAPPIFLIHDETVDINDLRPLDSNYPIYPVISERNVTGTFLNPQNATFGGQNLVAFAQTITTTPMVPASKSDLNDILANTPLWRANFAAGKTGFNGTVGDTANYDISGTGLCNADLVSCLKAQLSTANRNTILGSPLNVGMGVQWSDRPVGGIIGGPDGYKIPIEILGVVSGGLVSGGSFTPVALPGSCQSVTTPVYYQPVNCGQILIDIPITQKFEREAFNVSMGIGAAAPLTGVTASVVVKDSGGNDASSQFTLIVASDPQGATSGGSLSSSETVQWQLIPKAGAGGTSGTQYNVSATLNYTVSGQSYSINTQTVSITVMPLPQLQITYAVPYLAIQNKTEKIRITVQNTGTGPAHNFTAAAAQPMILANPSATESAAAFQWNFNINGSSPTANGALQSGVTTINFGDIPAGGSVSGYFGIVVSNCNYNDATLHTDCGYILDSTATIAQQDYNGVKLDPLVGAPAVQFVPAVGGTVFLNAVPQPGYTVTATRNGVTLGSDITDAGGGYFIGDLTAGPLTLTVTDTTGTVQSVNNSVTALADSSTNFVDFKLTPSAPVPVSITVTTSVPGLAFRVDGTSYTTPQTFKWNPGDTHLLATTALQPGATGTQYVFASWSNGGAMTQGLTVPAIATTYTANFTTQFLLTTTVSPANSGTLTPATGYVNAGSVVTLAETPANGYQFTAYSSGVTSPFNMTAPTSVVANFAPIAPILTAAITSKTGAASARVWTITLSNQGSGIGLNTQLTSLTFTGTGCTTPPAVATALPLTIGNIGPLGSASGNVTINFAGCPATTKFTVKVGYTANSGAYSNSASFSNQFQ